MGRFSSIAILLACLLPGSALPCGPQDGASAAQARDGNRPYRVGERIKSGLTLKDLAGVEHNLLEDLRYLETVRVLVFWGYRDPIARGYEKRLVALEKEMALRGVSLLLVNANHDEITYHTGDPLARLKKYVETRKLTLPILIDPENLLADRLKALTNAHAFIIDHKGVLRYSGKIDDDPKGRLGDRVRQSLRDAINQVLDGEKVEFDLTRPGGRRIKRKPSAPDTEASGA